MSDKQDCCYFGRGKVYKASNPSQDGWGCNFGYNYGSGATDGYRGEFMGNVENLSLSVNSTLRQTVTSLGQPFGGSCGAVTIDGVEFSMSVSCHSAANLALAFAGKAITTANNLPPVVERAVLPDNTNGMYSCDSFYSFDPVGVDPATVVIKREDNNVILEQGVDYVATSLGVEFLVGQTLPVNTSLLFSYSYNTSTVTCIEPFVDKISPVTLTYKGINVADNSEFMVTLYKVLLSPTSAYELINAQEFTSLQLSGVLLPDTNRPEGSSQYFKIIRT